MSAKDQLERAQESTWRHKRRVLPITRSRAAGRVPGWRQLPSRWERRRLAEGMGRGAQERSGERGARAQAAEGMLGLGTSSSDCFPALQEPGNEVSASRWCHSW